jgi:hypothetical protein
VFKRVSSFENTTFSPFRTQRDTNFEIFHPIENHILKLGGGAVLLLWAHIFSPFGMNRQKTESLEPNEVLSLPLVIK